MSSVDWTLEVVVVPVSDLAASIAFYRDQVGFGLDHETETEFMHVAHLTPRGWGCSVVGSSRPRGGMPVGPGQPMIRPWWPASPSAARSRSWSRSRTSSGV